MWKYLPVVTPIINLVEGIIDSYREPVKPIVGSVIYCDLAFGYAEHSGVYIGNNEIVHLNGKGHAEIVDPKGFMKNTTAMNIYVSCEGYYPAGKTLVADRAKSRLEEISKYHIVLDNCHHFTAGCLTGNFNNTCSFLWMLKLETKDHLRTNTWRHWNYDI